MPDNLKINVLIAVNAKGFKRQLDRIKQALDGLGKGAKDAGKGAKDASKDLDGMGKSLGRIGEQGLPAWMQTRRVGKEADIAKGRVRGLSSGLGTLARRLAAIAGAYFGFQGARALSRQLDTYTELNNRIRLVAASEQELISVREKLFAISLRTRSSVAANAQLYSRLSQASATLGYSQTDLLKVTEILNKQVLIGGNNASEAAAGLVQFAQGIASGRLQGDELRSVLENLLGVQQGLIDGFALLEKRGQIDFSVTRANIRDLASEGVLGADLLLSALLAVADETEERFEQVAVTIGGAFTNLWTGILARLGLGDEAIGSSGAIASTVQKLADVVTPATVSENLFRRVRAGDVQVESLTAANLEAIGKVAEKRLADFQARVARAPGYYGGGAEQLALEREIDALERGIDSYERLVKSKRQAQSVGVRGLAAADAELLERAASLDTDTESAQKDLDRDVAAFNQRLEALRADNRRRVALAGLPLFSGQGIGAGDLDTAENLKEINFYLERRRRAEERYQQVVANADGSKEREEARAARGRARTLAQARRRDRTAARAVLRQFEKDSNELDKILDDRAKKLTAAIQGIDAAMLDFLSPFERERVELKRWQEETLKVLRETPAAYAEYARQVEAVTERGLADIANRELDERRKKIEEMLRQSREGVHGLLRGLEDYADSALDVARNLEYAVGNAFRNLEDELTRFLTRGEFSLRRFLRDLAEDVARTTIRVGVTGPLASALGARLRAALPGLPAAPGFGTLETKLDELNADLSAKTDEVVVAQEGTRKAAEKLEVKASERLTELRRQTNLLERIAACSCQPPPAQHFRADGGAGRQLLDAALSAATGVPRFHGGGVVGGPPGKESLAFVEGGEGIISRRGLAALGRGGPPQQVQVVVENRGANQQEVVEQRAVVDGQKLIVQVALDDVDRRGPLSRRLEQAYGLGRRTG